MSKQNNRITQKETYSPYSKARLPEFEKKYVKAQAREEADRAELLRWLIEEKGFSQTYARVLVSTCFLDSSLLEPNRQEVLDYFEQLTQGTTRISTAARMAIDVIKHVDPAFMITISLPMWADDTECVAYINRLLKLTNQSIWGRRWWNKDGGLIGIAVGEPHIYSKKLRGTLHFHLLVKSIAEISSAGELEEHLHRQLPHVLDHHGNQLFNTSLVQVEPVDKVHGVAFYLTKSFIYRDFREGDFHLQLTTRGIEGVNPRPRNSIRCF